MTGPMKFGIAGVIIGLILLLIVPTWLALAIIAVSIAIPVGGYLMLDPSQRRRLKDIRRRRQIGH